jgi:alpha-amylase/alpha-mannosidase (GH57 family)
MHQPPGNLRYLIDYDPWAAEQIVRCYERPVRYARRYADVAQFHIGFSGILLEQLRSQEIIDRYRHIIDLPQLFADYRDTPNIEPVGMGYFHPIFPFIPSPDWGDQIRAGYEIISDCFGRAPHGFWPSEMAFTMEMIPLLVKTGYRYVIVDGDHVRPQDGIDDHFRPYLACYEGACITVIPCDNTLSRAQQAGLNPLWFYQEVHQRCFNSPRPSQPRLVTTWTGGENGGWFRQLHEEAGFFGVYFAPYMESVRANQFSITPINLSQYIRSHYPTKHARVQTGSWNIGTMSGYGHWTGSQRQRQAATTIATLSQRYWALMADPARSTWSEELAIIRRLILEAQTSCYLFWGDAWLPRLEKLTLDADTRIHQLELKMQH